MFYKPLPLPIGLSSVKLDSCFSSGLARKKIAELPMSGEGKIRTYDILF